MLDWLVQAGLSFLVGAAVGATVAYFLDDIANWASRAFNAILDGLDRAVEWAVEGIVYLINKGGEFYKGVEVLVRNVRGKERIEHRTEKVPPSEVPNDIRRELEDGVAKLVNRRSFEHHSKKMQNVPVKVREIYREEVREMEVPDDIARELEEAMDRGLLVIRKLEK